MFRHLTRKLLSLMLIALSATACGIIDKAISPATLSALISSQPTLSDEAEAALARAEGDIERARAAHALWTTAESAIRKAREAAQVGDSATVIAQSEIASDLAGLGLAQRDYPTTEK